MDRVFDDPLDDGCNAAMLQYMRDGKTYVAIQSRGLIALPADIRRRLDLDRPGAQVEVTERPDGVIELRPMVAVPADQAWFWTERWQRMEREVDEQIARGEGTAHDSIEALFDHLERT